MSGSGVAAANPMGLDFDQLEPGASFETAGRTITEADLVSFCALTGDWHPQHSDAEWAASSQFGERIAHGMMLVSYAVGLVPFAPDRIVALRSLDGVTFKRPALIGDTIHLDGSVRETKPLSDELGLVVMSWNLRNQRDELVVRIGVSAVWRRGERAAGAGAGKPTS